MDQFQYIRTTYNVPAYYGANILFRGKLHRIVGAENSHLIVNTLGSETKLRLHPTWEVNYNCECKEEKEHDQLGDIALELQALRAWKEKARPFLEESLKNLAGRIKYNPDMGTKKNREKHYELTELLGEG